MNEAPNCPRKPSVAADEYGDEEELDDPSDPADDCGLTYDATCMKAGTEWCDFECPIRRLRGTPWG